MTGTTSKQRWWPQFGPRTRQVFKGIEHFLATVGLFTIVYHTCFELSVVVSGSMAPTLRGTNVKDGDWVLAEKISYWFRRPARWEIVAYQSELGLQVMKRVVGLPGETVQMYDRKELRINEQPAEFPANIPRIPYLAYGNLADGKPVPCGDGYYVLGDDTRDSDDSRFNGPVSGERIRGRSWLIVWPLSRIGFVR